MEVFGVVASSVALVEVLIKGTKALKKIKDGLGVAPEELDRLFRVMTRLQSILVEIQNIGIDKDDGPILADSLGLAESWRQHVREVEEDIWALDRTIDKLGKAFEASSLTSRNLRARFKKLLSDHELEQHEKKLWNHQMTFTLMITVVTAARSRREHRREQQGISSVISQVADLSRHIHSLQVSSTSLSRTSATSYGEIQPGGVNYHAASYSSSSTFTQSIHMSHSLRHQIAGELDKLPCEQATHRETKAALHAVIRSASPEAITCSAPLPPNSGTAVGVNAPAISFTQTTQAVSTGNHINPNLGFAEKVEAVFTLQCRVFGYQVSLGSVYGRRQRKVNVSKKFGQVKTSDSWHYDIVLHPLSHLTEVLYRVQVDMSPGWKFSVNPMRYTFNTSPELKSCLDRGDLQGLYQLFAANKARPDDLIAPWGNTLLHEAVARYCIGVPNMLELVKVLLQEGVDPNMLNHRKRTPLSVACHLMQESSSVNKRLLPLAEVLISNNADLSIPDEEGNTSCMLIFRSQHGLTFMEEVVYRYIGLDTFSDLKSLDLWLMSSIARTTPALRARLEAENRSFRTEPEISSCIKPRHDELLEIDASEQISWLRAAPAKERCAFLSLLFSFGTLEMVQPFLSPDSGLDVNETVIEEDGYSSKSFIRAAARMGNLDVVVALAKAGARLDQVDWHWRANNLCTGVLDELIERWQFMSYRRPVPGRRTSTVESELWILKFLLEQPNHESPNALYAALWPDSGADSTSVLVPLLERGYGRRDGMPARTNHERDCGSEILEAVKHEQPYLQTMLDYGLALECEDRTGVTAILYAVDNAAFDVLEKLIKAGANLIRRPGCGISALELAESNFRAGHPRPTNRAWSYWSWFKNDGIISMEEDRRVLKMLADAVQKRDGKELPLCELHPFWTLYWDRS